jgi:hypothetical protein
MSAPLQVPPVPTFSPQSPPPSPPRRSPWLWLAIGVPVVLLVVAAVVSFVLGPRGEGDVLTVLPEAEVADPEAEVAVPEAEVEVAAPEAEVEGTEVEPGTAGGSGSRSSPLAVGGGSTARIGDYDVAVVEFTADGTDRVLTENEFNPAPTHDVYALVTLQVTYHGEGTGRPWMDLTVTLHGGDSASYVDYQCLVLPPDGLVSLDDLPAGGAARGNFCLDVPLAALDGGVLAVEETGTFGDAVYWTLP